MTPFASFIRLTDCLPRGLKHIIQMAFVNKLVFFLLGRSFPKNLCDVLRIEDADLSA